MRRFIGKGLVRSMENENLKTGDEEKEVGDNANSLETDVAEINDSAADGEAHQAETDTAEATAAALESFALALRGAQQNGGLNEHGAAMLNIGLEHLLARVGIEMDELNAPALESYGTTSARVTSGNIALEAVNETIQRIWKAIKDAIVEAYEWVKKYWLSVFGAAEKLKGRAKKLEELSRSTVGTPKEKTFDNDRLARALAIDNAVPTSLVGEAGSVKEAVSMFVSNIVKIGGEVGEVAIKALDELKGDSIGPLLGFLKPLGGEKVADPQAEGIAAGAEGIEVFRSKQLPGGMALISRVPAANRIAGPGGSTLEAMIKTIGETGYSVGKYSNKIKDEPTSKKITVLSQADAGKIAQTVGQIADELIAYRAGASKIEEFQSRLGKAADKIASSAGNEEDEAKRKDLAACKGIATMSNKLFTQPGTQLAKYVVTTSKALLDVVEESLKQYKSAA